MSRGTPLATEIFFVARGIAREQAKEKGRRKFFSR